MVIGTEDLYFINHLIALESILIGITELGVPSFDHFFVYGFGQG